MFSLGVVKIITHAEGAVNQNVRIELIEKTALLKG